ncbi:FtsB family cell division protein [Polymorphobacter multimanifer]|uniref:Cell division protein FtsB n=1 Tax=Polymorphobacter multimanifer TaxID=1070431 RepID=A0A841KZS0_9SPHN|nr:septum formation initiator family protein [Polymorphobacter multimanifer]MBB6226059.1 cell division protein FtsB [Polymorphobacter multimanifer]
MRGDAGLFDLLKRAIVPAVCMLMMGYFLVAAITGPTGVLSWRGFETEKSELAEDVAARAQEKAALEKQVALLDPRGVDLDMADELVRRNLNVVKPDEVIITLPDKTDETATQ